MSDFIRLQMFKEQKKGYKSGNYAVPFVPPTRPFTEWKVGYFVKSSVSSNAEEWKITEIKSSDGLMHNEDCTVTLTNAADETRTLKGRSLRGSYSFVSTGDVQEAAPPAPAETDAPPREDVQWLTLNIAGIREYHARKYGNEGSRVLMLGDVKTAYVVADDPGTIDRLIRAAGGKLTTAPLPE